MRLDIFLKQSRLIKRRSQAKESCDQGFIEVNHQPAKPAHEVKIGDEIILSFWNRTLRVMVQELPAKGTKIKDASGCYKVIADEWKEREDGIF